MLEILKGTLVPTVNTVGEEGQFYIRQFQGGRHTMSGEVYVCDSIRTDIEDLQHPKTYYNWQQIFTAEDVIQRLDTLRDNTEMGMEDMHAELSDEIESLKKQLAELGNAKETDITIVTKPTGKLEHNTEYHIMGWNLSSFTLTLPKDIPENFYSKLVVKMPNGNPTQLAHPSNVVFAGDDCVDGKFEPIANKRYEIVYNNVGKMYRSTTVNYPYIILAKVTAF